MNEEEYVKDSGKHCPICGSDSIYGTEIVAEDTIYIQEMGCDNCNASWNDVLKLSGISDLKIDGNPAVQLMLGEKVLRWVAAPMVKSRGVGMFATDIIMFAVDITGVPDSDQLYCEDQYGFRYKRQLPDVEGMAIFTKI